MQPTCPSWSTITVRGQPSPAAPAWCCARAASAWEPTATSCASGTTCCAPSPRSRRLARQRAACTCDPSALRASRTASGPSWPMASASKGRRSGAWASRRVAGDAVAAPSWTLDSSVLSEDGGEMESRSRRVTPQRPLWEKVETPEGLLVQKIVVTIGATKNNATILLKDLLSTAHNGDVSVLRLSLHLLYNTQTHSYSLGMILFYGWHPFSFYSLLKCFFFSRTAGYYGSVIASRNWSDEDNPDFKISSWLILKHKSSLRIPSSTSTWSCNRFWGRFMSVWELSWEHQAKLDLMCSLLGFILDCQEKNVKSWRNKLRRGLLGIKWDSNKLKRWCNWCFVSHWAVTWTR